jgi:hypothetical protein
MIVAPATVPAPKPRKGCGLQNRESFLWSSTLLFKQYPNFVASYKCRVSLVHPKVAVTAAHCLQDKGYYQVRIGGTIRTVARVVVHPSFKQASLQNDVALLVLDKPFKMDKAGVVCVPPPGSLFDGNNCTATTRTSEEDGSLGDWVRWKSPGSLRESGSLPGMDRRGYDRKRTRHQHLQTLIVS